MADRYTLDACDWPLIINDGDTVVAMFNLPHGSTGDDETGRAQVERANSVVRFLNDEHGEAERRHALSYPSGCHNLCEACYVRLNPPTSAESQAYIDGGAQELRALRAEVARG